VVWRLHLPPARPGYPDRRNMSQTLKTSVCLHITEETGQQYDVHIVGGTSRDEVAPEYAAKISESLWVGDKSTSKAPAAKAEKKEANLEDLTVAQLRERASEIEGSSHMRKSELLEALSGDSDS